MIQRFEKEMTCVENHIRTKTMLRGLVCTVSESIPVSAFALAVCYGAHLIAAKEIHFKNVIKLVRFQYFNADDMNPFKIEIKSMY